MSGLQEFVAQATDTSCGVRIDGVSPQNIIGRGIGVLALRDLDAGETLLSVPTSALKTEFKVSNTIRDAVQGISVQGLLALDLMLDDSEWSKLWQSLMPSRRDMMTTIPFWWPTSLQALLPQSMTGLVGKQHKKFDADWAVVHGAFTTITRDDYEYYWFIVGTRTFYYTPPKSDGIAEEEQILDPDECLALVPIADFFNHAEHGCEVNFTADGYTFRSHRSIRKGEEIFISYGYHSNDFLLAEYGFCLETNDADVVSLDEILLDLFNEEQTRQLQSADYLGSFVLQHTAACYRTETALRLLCMPRKLWQLGLEEGFDDNDEYIDVVNDMLLQALERSSSDTVSKIKQISMLDLESSPQKDMLRRRWEQIWQQLDAAIARYKMLRGANDH